MIRPPAFLLGLTGSIGMGKSTVAAMMADMGVPVFDADAEVRRLQGPGGALLPMIEAAFPRTTGPLGVDRQALGTAIFGDPVARRALEAIVHPAVGRARAAFLRRHRAQPLLVLDVPLLFETGLDRQLDAVALVTAPAWIQRRRVLTRPGMCMARLRAVRASQMPDREKRRRADFLISTARSKAETRRAVARLVTCLRASGRR